MLLFLDGQAHYDSSRIGAKYSAMTSNKTIWSIAAEGRFGNCVKRVAVDNFCDGYLDIAPLTTRTGIWTPTNAGVCGFAVKLSLDQLGSPNEHGGSDGLFCIMESGHFYWKVAINPSGTLSLIQAWGPLDSYGVVMAVSGEGLPNNAWSFVEVKWVLHDTAGSVEIRVNTVPVLTYTGDTTAHDPSWVHHNVWNAVRLLELKSQASPLLTVRLCDLYLADLTTADADDVHDFLGDGVIRTIFPNAPGAAASWTPNGTATNWDATNDKPVPDDDGTYVRAITPGSKDLYNFDDIPVGSVVKGAQMCILAKKETEGSTVLTPIVHPTTIDYAAPPQGVASPNYDRYLTQPWDLNPDTMAPWTDTDINNGQWGFIKTL